MDNNSENEGLEVYKSNLEREKLTLEIRKLEIQRWAIGFNSLVTLATIAIRSLESLNLAALMVLLTLFGHAAIAKFPLPQAIYNVMEKFVFGLGCALFCNLLAYVFQWIELETKKKCFALGIRLFACGFAFASFVFFIWGLYDSASVFRAINVSS